MKPLTVTSPFDRSKPSSRRRAVSVACGERKLLPKVREAARETLVVADGFSCRSEID